MVSSIIRMRWSLYITSGILLLLLTACGRGTTGSTPSTPTVARANGFGIEANHVHSLLTLPDQVVLLATHYGTYRSGNGGASWQRVSGGSGQLMQGLMDYSLVASPLDAQRLYLLTLPSVAPHPGTLGLYTSADQGRTWKLASTTASLTSGSIYLVAAGNASPNQVYIYLPDLGSHGLKVSTDDGQHFQNAGVLPFGRILGMLALPGAPGQLLAFGSDGLIHSTDGGSHWQVVGGITGGIYYLTTSGPHRPIYASGDAGTYVSNDGGKTFLLVNIQASYGSLVVAPSQSQVLYGRTGTAVYRSTDGGHTWTAMPHVNGNLGDIAISPSNAMQPYLSLSYPAAIYRFNQSSKTWISLTPKA